MKEGQVSLSVGIVSTNEKEFLKRCLDAFYSYLPSDMSCEVIVIDNCSTDGTQELIIRSYPEVKLIVNNKKCGFSKNLNMIINQSNGDYILILDANAFVTYNYISELIKIIRENEQVGIVAGKLLKADVNGNPILGSNGKYIIDSTGHVIFKNRRTINRGELEEDKGLYDQEQEVFSLCTAATLFNRKTLEDIKLFGEYFDETFYAYKEELDLCWRARLRGWKIVYTPKAMAYHVRSWGMDKARSKIPRWIRRESFKNRYLMVIKNDYLINILKDLPYILWHEIKAFVYMIFREPHLFLVWLQIVMLLPFTMQKRSEIMKKAAVGPNEIRKWFV